MKKKMSVLFIVLIVFSLALSACGAGSSASAPTPSAATAVTPVKANAATIAEASVVPLQSANLNFSASGTVEQIFKPEGSSILKDEPIARLQGQERLQASLAAAKLAQASAQQSLTKLKDSGAVNKAAATLKVANADKALKDAKKDMTNADYKRGTRDQINEAQARYIVAQDAFKTANDNYSSLAGQNDDNLTKAYALTVLGQTRQHRDKALADLNYLLEKPDPYDYNIVTSKLDVAQANLDQAKSDLAKLNSDGINSDDLAVAQANLDNANAQVAAAQSSLKDLILKAPFDGTIITNNLKVGESAGPGGQTAQVVLANTTQWQVETTDLTELNINNIHESDPVKITFDALPGLDLTGKVLRIQSLGTNKQGDITYKVTISLDKQDERLRWNMTALVAFANKP
jgi:multidrug resistance efflux pump